MTGTSIVSVQFSTDGNGNPVPSWGTIDLTNNLLNFSVPYVSSDTTYSFTLVVTSTEAHTYTYNVGVTLYVKSCKVSNWGVCLSSDNSKWSTCNSGYTLNKYAWSLQTTSTVSQTSSNTSPSATSTTSSAAGTASTIAAGVGVAAAAASSILNKIFKNSNLLNIDNSKVIAKVLFIFFSCRSIIVLTWNLGRSLHVINIRTHHMFSQFTNKLYLV